MTIKIADTDSRHDRVGPQNHPDESVLASEAAFWREMIDSCDEFLKPDAIERMRHALSLAERRIADVQGSGLPAFSGTQVSTGGSFTVK